MHMHMYTHIIHCTYIIIHYLCIIYIYMHNQSYWVNIHTNRHVTKGGKREKENFSDYYSFYKLITFLSAKIIAGSLVCLYSLNLHLPFNVWQAVCAGQNIDHVWVLGQTQHASSFCTINLYVVFIFLWAFISGLCIFEESHDYFSSVQCSLRVEIFCSCLGKPRYTWAQLLWLVQWRNCMLFSLWKNFYFVLSINLLIKKILTHVIYDCLQIYGSVYVY